LYKQWRGQAADDCVEIENCQNTAETCETGRLAGSILTTCRHSVHTSIHLSIYTFRPHSHFNTPQYQDLYILDNKAPHSPIYTQYQGLTFTCSTQYLGFTFTCIYSISRPPLHLFNSLSRPPIHLCNSIFRPHIHLYILNIKASHSPV